MVQTVKHTVQQKNTVQQVSSEPARQNAGVTRDTDRDWARVAEEDPYWAVLSDDKFRGRDIAGPEREFFFSSGEGSVESIFSVIRAHLAPGFAPPRSLDFGCGVGRMLVPIARRSGEAIGVDVAPRMLELAHEYVRAANLTNVQLLPADHPIMQGEPAFDFVNTYIVLQHIPPARGYRIVANLIRLLRPGGVASLQLTYARPPNLARNPEARYFRNDGGTIVREGTFEAPFAEGTILMFDYDLNQMMVLLAEAEMAPIIVYSTGDHTGHMGVHLFARKPL